MSELFETINANAEEANVRAQEEARATYDAHEQRLADKKLVAKMRRQKATRTLILRIAIAVVLCVGLWLAKTAGLVVVDFALLVVSAIFAWLAFWLGAWVQFVWCKGGLLT